MWNLVYFLFLQIIGTCLTTPYDPGNRLNISTEGDIVIGGLFPIHKEGGKENVCGDFNEIPGYQYMEAMRYAVDKINQRSDLLPGITLATIIYDTCRSPTIAADRTKDFIQLSLSLPANGPQLAGIIGPFVSGISKIVGNFLRVFEIPQISYASLSVELSNKDIYNYFFRTVPPDSFFAEALAELLERLGWNYVSLIYSKGTYPETGAREVIKALRKRKICVAKKHRLKRFPKAIDYEQAISKAAHVKEANVVVFVTIQRDSRKLLQAKNKIPQARRLLIVGSIAWSNRDDITNGLGAIADGTITFAHQEGQNQDFEAYFRSLNLSNYNASYKGWFRRFWQKQFNCSLNDSIDSLATKYPTPCTGHESLHTKHMEIAPTRVVINAVNAMARALHNMREALCPHLKIGLCSAMKPLKQTLLRKFLKNVTFLDSSFGWPLKFDQNNEVEGNYSILNFQPSGTVTKIGGKQIQVYSYEPIGSWTGNIGPNEEISGKLDVNLSDIRWANENATKPSSVCSIKCTAKHITIPRPGPTSECCWDCDTCKDQDIILNNTCHTCDTTYIPNANLSKCLKLTLKYVDMNTPLAMSITILAVCGMTAVLSVFVVFFLNRDRPLIKASSLNMCYMMFLGIFLIFLVPSTLLAKPTSGLCFFGRFLMGISYAICYAPLYMKLWHMHRVFTSTQKNNVGRVTHTTGMVGPRSQLLITFGLIAIQALFFILISSTNPPYSIEKFYADQGELHLECYLSPPVFIAYLSFDVVLMMLCTVYAFFSRHFRKNFNEAMHIGVTMYVTCVLWVVFLASFLNVNDSISRVYWMSGASVVIGWITLLGLFAPKVYQVFTKTTVDKNALMEWQNSVLQRLAISSSEEPTTPGLGKQNPMTMEGEKLQLSAPQRMHCVDNKT